MNSVIDRYLHHINFCPITGCWIWSGPLDKKGYGRIGSKLAHRVLYAGVKGEIPNGLTIDHLCYNRGCVNPDHLEAVTMFENIRRAYAKCVRKYARGLKVSCRHGHTLTPENTVIVGGYRACRTCKNAARNETRRKHRRLL